jgi:phosphatidylinositol-3-phosphatase
MNSRVFAASLLAAGLTLAACGGSTASAPQSPSASASPAPASRSAAGSPCGQGIAAPARYDHIYLIVFENLSYASYLSDNLPYIHSVAAKCGLATNYSAIAHPSLPNYLAMTSGGTQGFVGKDSSPGNPGSLAAGNIFNEVKLSGRQWRSYSESMPSNCYHADDPPAPNAYYTVHHEPAVYYADIAADCNNWDVPQGTTISGAMISDINSGNLPAFAFVGPNDDGGCSTCGGHVDPQKLDGYLHEWLPHIFATRSYRAGKTAIFITWDESDSTSNNHVAMIAVAPSIPAGTRSSVAFNHYSMLRSIEEMLGISNLLGSATTAPSMRSTFSM